MLSRERSTLSHIALVGAILALTLGVFPALSRPPAQVALTGTRGAIEGWLLETYEKTPIRFESNQGQIADSKVKFLSRGLGYTLLLMPAKAVLALHRPEAAAPRAGYARQAPSSALLTIEFLGASAHPRVVGRSPLPGKVNYLVGNDPSKWRTSIPLYAQVAYGAIYPGIDLVFHGNQQQLEYDFVVAPGADPTVIRLAVQGPAAASGRSPLWIDNEGNLVLHTSGGSLIQRAPVVYQEVDGLRQPIAGRYVLLQPPDNSPRARTARSGLATYQVGFRLGAYDRAKPLVIDPVLSYATYLGGNHPESGYAIAVDAAGNAYVTGETILGNFPTTPGAYDTAYNGGASDLFVTKVNPSGSELVFSTYLGGSGDEEGHGIAVDASGSVYLTGNTNSTNFPTTPSAYDTAYNSGAVDAFVTKLNASGTGLAYSTYLGGSQFDEGRGIAVDGSGNAYVTGRTDSDNFPTTPTSFDQGCGTSGFCSGFSDAFVTKLNAAGSGLTFSTYLGGSDYDYGQGIAVDASAKVYVTGTTSSFSFPEAGAPYQSCVKGGTDVFVTKINASGTLLFESTCLGGNYYDYGLDIAVDDSDYVYVTGRAGSTNFPTKAAYQATYGGGAYDVFVTKFNEFWDDLAYSTYLGGSASDVGRGIAADSGGRAHVTGTTWSTNFPTEDPLQPDPGGGGDAFVAALNADGDGLVYATYLGGAQDDAGHDIALGTDGNAFLTGETESADFPATPGAFDTSCGADGNCDSGYSDVFVARICGSSCGSGGSHSVFLPLVVR